MRRLVVLIIFVGLVSIAQAEPWDFSVDVSLMSTQSAYSDNWAGSETGSLIWTFNTNAIAQKAISPVVYNKNTLKLSYGQTHNQDGMTEKWQSPSKSTDLIDFESVFTFTLGGWADPFASARLESQFFSGGDNLVESTVFNPLKFSETAGVAKTLLKEDNKDWSIRLGAGFRQFNVRTVPVNGDKTSDTSVDGGLEFVSDYRSPMFDNAVTFSSKLNVYQALYYSKADDLEGLPNEEYWKAVDINWENIFTANITKYLMVNLYLQLLYDKEVDLGGRLKQTLSLGLTYNF
jgi:hypothetical protein